MGVTSYQLLLFSKTSGKRQDPAGLLTVAQVIMFRTDMSKSGGARAPGPPCFLRLWLCLSTSATADCESCATASNVGRTSDADI